MEQEPKGTSGDLFSAEDLERIAASTFIESVEYHRALRSTNDRASELGSGQSKRLPTPPLPAPPLPAPTLPAPPLPALVLTDEQTAGRGRGENRWWSSAGALTFSLLIDASANQLQPALWPKISLAVGLAVCDAVEPFLDSHSLALKWPNDVLCQGRKLCGILTEVHPRRKDLLVLGIGLNVNNPLASAPAELRPSATSLCELAEHRFSPTDLLIAILQQLPMKMRWVAEQRQELRQQWKQRCMLTGRSVQIELPNRCLWGVCEGIDPDGALVLQTITGRQRCLSGVIQSWA